MIYQERRVGKTAGDGWDGKEYKEENKLGAGEIRDTLTYQHAVVTMCDHLFAETPHEMLRL